MKYLLFMFLGLTSLSSHANQLPIFECHMDEDGYVNLYYYYQIDSTRRQPMVHAFGNERDWNNPYKVRELCKTVKEEITSFAQEQWGKEQCSYIDNATASYRYMIYNLSDKGAKAYGSKTIWFLPTGDILSISPTPVAPVDKDFFKIINPALQDSRICNG